MNRLKRCPPRGFSINIEICYTRAMTIQLHESWKDRLTDEFEKDYFKALTTFVREEYERERIYPKPNSIFRALELCPFEDIKVVILGQDPYHGPGQANGLCFAVNENVDLPPSLKNIYKELADDMGVDIPQSGDLSRWAKQGVLLLNATLTVQAHKAGSHQNKGWEDFTDAIIKKISDESENVVFILWGRYAQNKGSKIDESKHLVLKAPHPSPLSSHRGFFGSKPFSKANEYLKWNGKDVIKW